MAKLVDRHKLNLKAFHSTQVTLGDIGGYDEVATSFLGFAETQQVVGIEGVGIPFAFYEIGSVASLRDNKVDFVLAKSE